MAGDVLSRLVVEIAGNSKPLADAMDEAEHKSTSFGDAVKIGVGVALGNFAVEGAGHIRSFVADGIGEFVNFDTKMREVFTLLPGISQQNMGQMTQHVKDFATEMGVLPEKVVPALYQSLSAGVPAGNVFEFLTTAQKGRQSAASPT